jgi:hypothetical protein
MHLGIVVTNDTAEQHAVGLTQAALARGWRCRCFLTDRGVLLLNSPRFLELARAGQLRVDVCEHSWDKLGGGPHPAGITLGSQYQDAELALECERILVL